MSGASGASSSARTGLQWGRGLGAAEWELRESFWRRPDILQWGRGLGAAECRDSGGTPPQTFRDLQWGRGLGAAECRPRAATATRSIAFNGAAA